MDFDDYMDFLFNGEKKELKNPKNFLFNLLYWQVGPTYADVHIHIPLTHEPPFIHCDEQFRVALFICVFRDVSQYWPVYELGQLHVNETLVEFERTEQVPSFRQIGL